MRAIAIEGFGGRDRLSPPRRCERPGLSAGASSTGRRSTPGADPPGRRPVAACRGVTVILIPKPKSRSAGYRSIGECRRSLLDREDDRRGNGRDRTTADHQKDLFTPNNGSVGMVIGPIGAYRGSERGAVGTGSLLDVRGNQRTLAILISSLGSAPSPLRKLPLPFSPEALLFGPLLEELLVQPHSLPAPVRPR